VSGDVGKRVPDIGNSGSKLGFAFLQPSTTAFEKFMGSTVHVLEEALALGGSC
jgi:hypothetical protein